MSASLTLFRRGAILILALGLGLGAWHLAANGAEKEKPFDKNGTRLAERVEEFRELRRKGDWVPLYDMVSPTQRQKFKLVKFLEFFGHGVLEVKRIDVVETSIDPEQRRAQVNFHLEAEVDLVRAPPQFRNARIESPDDLRMVNDRMPVPWVWEDGEWYWEVEDQFVTGVDPTTGRTLNVPGRPQK